MSIKWPNNATTIDYAGKEKMPYCPINKESRRELLKEIARYGINADILKHLTLSQLSDLLCGVNEVINLQRLQSKAQKQEPRMRQQSAVLSDNDRKILRALLESEGRNVSSLSLSRQLQIPLTTVQRKRKRLEEFLHNSYSLKLEKFDQRLITLFISVESGRSIEIGRSILALSGITLVVRTLSGNMDIKAEAIAKTNDDIVNLLERVKAVKGVRNVLWTESIQKIGENKDTYISIINSD